MMQAICPAPKSQRKIGPNETAILAPFWSMSRFSTLPPDFWAVALCVLLKFACYISKYLILFGSPGRISALILLLLGEAARYVIPIPWGVISLSFEGAVFHRATSRLNDPEASDEFKKSALKANRKSASLPDGFQILLDLLDQFEASLLAFLKADCKWHVALAGSAMILLVPYILQSRLKGLIASVSKSRRAKESEM